MTPFELGQQAAFEKLGWSFSPLAKMIGRGALAGGGAGAITGGVAGYAGAPEGQGLSGALRGALAGGATGAALGGVSGGLGARRALKQDPNLAKGMITGQLGGKQLNTAQMAKDNPAMAAALRGTGRTIPIGAGVLGGGVAGYAAAPEEKPWYQKALGTVGLG